jgi:hypothetical protein
MKLPLWFRILYWLLLVAVLGGFLFRRVDVLLAGNANAFDTLVLAVWVALLLVPLFSEVELLGVKLKQVVDEAKKEIKSDITALRSEVSTAVAAVASVTQHFHLNAVTGQVPASSTSRPVRQPLEYKILNTLWAQQVNRFPDRSQLFTFRINAGSPEFLQFREAGNKLLGEGLIGETDTGQFYLTEAGFNYSRQHHADFPPDRWWSEDKIDQANLQRVLGAA